MRLKTKKIGWARLGLAALWFVGADLAEAKSSFTTLTVDPSPTLTATSATYSVTVSRTGSGNLLANLTCVNLPAGATATFSTNPVRFTGQSPLSNTVTLTISFAAGLPSGPYTFAVIGDDTVTRITTTVNSVTGPGGSVTSPSPPTLTALSVQGTSTQLTGQGGPGGLYQVQATSDLGTPSWSVLGTTTADPTGVFAFTDPAAASYPNRFYRAMLISFP
jgi:hypothetical protein